MPMDFIDHFSGWEGQTCSYTTDFITKNADKAKGLGMTEADYRKGLVNGHLGFVQGQVNAGAFPNGGVVLRGTKADGDKLTVTYKDGNFYINTEAWRKAKLSAVDLDPDSFTSWVEGSGGKQWDFTVPTHRKPPVSLNSNSIGAMTDEDAATMFVKTKDAFAKEKGINIKGANPQLDLEVYEAIAKQTGYTANEIRLKIEAYKASGKKLSSLKKKTLGKKVDSIKPDPIPPPPTKNDGQFVPWVEDAKPVTGGLKTEKKIDLSGNNYYEITKDGNKVAVIKQGTAPVHSAGKSYSYATEKVWKVSVYDTQGNWSTTLEYKTKKQAQEYAEKWADLKFKNVVPKVQPPEIHLSPSAPAVHEAVEDLIEKDLQNTLVYADEDVVKAYIKAKDQLAGQTSNKFTLYTKSDEFDEAIYHLMSKEYGVDLTGEDIKKHIANYLGAGNKVSVLKKKMIKSGELEPEAPTLKKTKAEKQFNTAPTNSKYEAQTQIDDMSISAERPVGAASGELSPSLADEVFVSLKNNIFAKMSDQSAYDSFAKQAYKMQTNYPDTAISPLDVIRAYDKKKAAQLGIENGFFYEKKIVEWASQPEGKSYVISHKATIKAQAEAEAKKLAAAEAKKAKEQEILKAINNDVPDLPEDSSMFDVISSDKARRLQDAQDPWTSDQRNGLNHYTGGSYTPMNQYLRGSTSHVTDYNRKAINDAQDGMRPVQEAFLVRRGAGYNSFGLGQAGKYGFDAIDHEKFKAMIGKTVQEDGFLSTSVGGEGAFGGSVKIEVEVTPGTYGAYVDHISQHRGEREFMLAHGTKYEVLRVEATLGWNGQPSQTLIRLRTIPGSHSKRRH